MYFDTLNVAVKISNIVGCHPEKGKNITQHITFWTIIIADISVLYMVSLYFFKKENLTFVEVTNLFESLCLIVHGTMKLTLPYVKRSDIADLLHRTTRLWKIEKIENEDLKKDCSAALRFLKLTAYTFFILSIVPGSFFICRPFFFEAKALPFFSYIPESVPFPLLVFLHIFVALEVVLLPALSFDTTFLSILLLTQVQYKLLNYEINKLFSFKNSHNKKEFQQNIKTWVDHHNYLIDLVDRLNNTVCEFLMVYLGIITITICFELHVVINTDKINDLVKAISYTFAVLYQFTLFYCLPTQLLIDEAEKITTSIYSSKWYQQLVPLYKSTMTIILIKCRAQLKVAAGGIININLITCLSIINKMISYFMFLRTMSEI